MTQHDTLFVRHPANPILTAKDWPYSMNSVFNPGATLAGRWVHSSALPRGRSPRPLSPVRGALGKRRRWVADRSPTDTSARPRTVPRGSVGHRGSAHHLRAGTRAIRRGVHILFARRPGRLACAHQGFPRLRKTRRHHAAGRQRRGSAAQENQRTMGFDSSADDAAGRSRLDFILARPAALGRLTSSCWKPDAVRGGTPTRLACRRRRSKRLEAG